MRRFSQVLFYALIISIIIIIILDGIDKYLAGLTTTA